MKRILNPYGRITDRVKTARNMPFRFCILIVYGRLRIVSFDLGTHDYTGSWLDKHALQIRSLSQGCK